MAIRVRKTAGTETFEVPILPPRMIAISCVCTTLALTPDVGMTAADATFADLSLEELGAISVTSVSKKKEPLADAPASIYVIGNDAIRRSGARTLPEVLRLAPNLLVAQINASQYAISARGFNSSTANKLLVLIDGRTVYTPLYSGVFWDAQDVLLEDVDRIEVISGPGGTLWGANAVNGVINVITRHSDATTGNLAQVTLGGSPKSVALRRGGALGSSGDTYRAYARFDDFKHTVRDNGAAVPDAWDRGQLGFRADWHQGQSAITIQGDAYHGSLDQAAPGQQEISGANLLARWENNATDGANLRVQAYYDHTSRDIPGLFGEQLNTFDLEVQYTSPETNGGRRIWGGGYRLSDDRIDNSRALAFLPAHRRMRWANLFLQQEYALRPNLNLSAGAKLEYNVFTGLEVLPSLKLAWKPTEKRLLWTGISRAIRAPSRIDREFFVPGRAPFVLAGGPDFRSEVANTLELGFRAQEGSALTYSLTLFDSRYDRLRSIDARPNGAFVLGNRIKGHVYGLEAWGSYQVTPSVVLRAGTLLLREDFSGPNVSRSLPGNDPRSQWMLGTTWNLGEGRELDVSLRHVGKLTSPQIPAYTAVDARFGWRMSKAIEVSIAGRNLFDAHHVEFASGRVPAAYSRIGRSIDLTLTVRF